VTLGIDVGNANASEEYNCNHDVAIMKAETNPTNVKEKFSTC